MCCLVPGICRHWRRPRNLPGRSAVPPMHGAEARRTGRTAKRGSKRRSCDQENPWSAFAERADAEAFSRPRITDPSHKPKYTGDLSCPRPRRSRKGACSASPRHALQQARLCRSRALVVGSIHPAQRAYRPSETPATSSRVSAKGPSMTVRPGPSNAIRLPSEEGLQGKWDDQSRDAAPALFSPQSLNGL
jgi:hypothetical protein